LLYLAIRAARRALAVNPEDANAYLILGEGYLRLLRDTRERAWAARMPDLVQLRRVQASTALNQAIALQPDLAQAHLELGGLYQEMGYFDLALEHLTTHARLFKEKGPPRGSSVEQFRQQLSSQEAALAQLSKTVDAREADFVKEAQPSRFRIGDRALMAWQRGLAGKARDLLLDTDVSAFGTQGMALELELKLQTGQARDLPDWLNEEHEAALGGFSYHWLRAQAEAALGHYALAQEEWKYLTLEKQLQNPGLHREMARLMARAVLAEAPGGECIPSLFWRLRLRNEFRSLVASFIQNLKQGADMCVLRGLVALEQGDVEEARVAFTIALDSMKQDAASPGVDFGGRVIAQTCLEWLKD
jgi:tetratricopeptide (TPR) repeat protein